MRNHKLLNQLERKFGNIAIPNLMTLIVFGMAIVFVLDTFINPDYQYNFSSLIYFNQEAILQGQVWRVLTFVFEPPGSNLMFILFTLYFYWMIGSALESNWGTFRFNVYYFTGVIGTIIGGLITGYATNSYLNLSLFLAFAMLYPNMEVRLFFVLPIKIKYLAWLDAILLGASFLWGDWAIRITILVSIINFLLYFAPEFWNSARLFFRRIYFKLTKRSPGNHQNQKWKNHWWDDNDNNPFR